MKIRKAVITAAAPSQRTLPLQRLVDRDGIEKSALQILIEEAVNAGIEDIAITICPGDEKPYREAAQGHASRLTFTPQPEPRGYGHALWCARDFIGRDPFLHLVGDHLYLSREKRRCAQQLIEVAASQSCPVSAVQATRESMLPYYGTVGGHRLQRSRDLYQIERVVEKPTPTEAEQTLNVPGLRSGHYLCLFGMHVLTPTVIEVLEDVIKRAPDDRVGLSPALSELAGRERHLALEIRGDRYNIGVKYGLLMAQLALALAGNDREMVLAQLVEHLASGHMTPIPPGT